MSITCSAFASFRSSSAIRFCDRVASTASGSDFGPRRALSGLPEPRCWRHLESSEEYIRSRRQSAARSIPDAASYASRMRAFSAAVKRLRVAFAGTSGSGMVGLGATGVPFEPSLISPLRLASPHINTEGGADGNISSVEQSPLRGPLWVSRSPSE